MRVSARVGGRRSTASWRQAPTGGRRAPAPHSSSSRSRLVRPASAIAYWCKRIRARSTPIQAESLWAADVDVDVLTPRGEDRVVECLIASRLAIQCPDRCSGSSVGRMPIITMWAPSSLALASAAFRLARTSASRSSAERPGSRTRRNVEFDVVGAQFGLVGRIGDRRQHFGIAHRGLIVAVDQIALDPSMPAIGRSHVEKLDRASMGSKMSRHSWTLRGDPRGAPSNSVFVMSSPRKPTRQAR